MAQVIFAFEGFNTIIQCLKEDIMELICQKFAFKRNVNINSLSFLYNGTQINMKLKFLEQANSFDKERNIMNILVDKIEQNKMICPKCGIDIKFNKELLNNLNSTNKNINHYE